MPSGGVFMIKKNRIVRDLFFGIMLLLCQVSLSNASIIYADKTQTRQNITSMKNGEIIENTYEDPQSNAITTVRFIADNNQLHQTIKRDDLSNKKSEEFSIHYEKTATNNLHVTLLEGKSPHSNQRWQKDISAEQVIIPASQDALEHATYALYNYVCQSNGVAHSAKQNNTNTDVSLFNNIFLDDKPFASTGS